MSRLEEENPEKLTLHRKQKCKYTAGICILLDDVDENSQEESKAPIIMPVYYPTKEELWVEIPQEII